MGCGFVDDVRGTLVFCTFNVHFLLYSLWLHCYFSIITCCRTSDSICGPFLIDYLCIAFNMSKYLISLNIGLLDLHAPFFGKVTSKRAWLGTGPDSSYKYPPRFHNVTPTTDSQYRKGTQVVEIHFSGWIFSCLSYIKSPFVSGDGACVCVQKDYTRGIYVDVNKTCNQTIQALSRFPSNGHGLGFALSIFPVLDS